MSPVLADIKRAFDAYKTKETNINKEKGACDKDPFSQHWMHHYLIPECLLVVDDYRKHGFNRYAAKIGYMYPCWVCSEEQVLRIMAEHGLL